MGSSSSSMQLIRAIRTIADDRVPLHAEDHAFWRDLFTVSFSVVDLHTVVTQACLRELRWFHPERLALVVYKCVSQIHAFCVKSNNNNNNNNVAQTSKRQEVSPQATINALMLLERILPIAMECGDQVEAELEPLPSSSSVTAAAGNREEEGEEDAVNNEQKKEEEDIRRRRRRAYARNFFECCFLQNLQCDSQNPIPSAFPPLVVFESDVENSLFSSLKELSAKKNNKTTKRTNTTSPQPSVPIGLLLVECVVQLCFTPGFALPASVVRPVATETATVTKAEEEEDAVRVVSELLWNRGIGDLTGVNNAVAKTTLWTSLTESMWATMTTHRRLLLEMLLVVCSSVLHQKRIVAESQQPSSSSTSSMVMGLYLTQRSPLFPTLVASLLNTVAAYSPAGSLPYSSHLVTTYEHLVVLCYQTLAAALDFGSEYGSVFEDTTTNNMAVDALEAISQGSPPSSAMSRTEQEDSTVVLLRGVIAEEDGVEDRKHPSLHSRGAPRTTHEEKGNDVSELSIEVSAATAANAAGGGETAGGATLSRGGAAAAVPDEPKRSPQHPATTTTTVVHNLGWRLLSCISVDEAVYVVEGIAPLFTNSTRARSTYLPNSQRRVFEQEELLLLLFKLLTRSAPMLKAFCVGRSSSTSSLGLVPSSRTTPSGGGGVGGRGVVGTTNNKTPQPSSSITYVTTLVDYFLRAKDDIAQFPVSQTSLCLLLHVTSQRPFVLSCNVPMCEYLPFSIAEMGKNATYNDVIVMSMLTMLLLPTTTMAPRGGSSSDATLQHMQPQCALVIANIAPYMTSIAPGTAQKLVWALEVFGRPSVLLHNPPRNGGIMCLVVESIMSLLQYQYRGSGCLAYTIARTATTLRDILSIFSDCSAGAGEGGRWYQSATAVVGIYREDDAAAATTSTVKSTAQRLDDDEATTTRSRSQVGDNSSGSSCSIPMTSQAASSTLTTISLRQFSLPTDPPNVVPYRSSLLMALRIAVDRLEETTHECIAVNDANIVDIPTILSNITMVGALPLPHPLLTRHVPRSLDTDEWIEKVLWSFLFTHSLPGMLGSAPYVKLLAFAPRR